MMYNWLRDLGNFRRPTMHWPGWPAPCKVMLDLVDQVVNPQATITASGASPWNFDHGHAPLDSPLFALQHLHNLACPTARAHAILD